MAPGAVPPRIFGIVAERAPVAVVFRRGPSKMTQQLVWDLDTDVVTPGQWINGHVFVRRTDLSPDGRLLVSAVSNYSPRQADRAEREHGAAPHESSFWTAVSRPPYFTALALWFMGPSYNGGGIWIDERTLGLNNQPYEYKTAKPMGKGYRVMDLDRGPGEDRTIFPELLKKRGWSPRTEFSVRKGIWSTGARTKRFAGGEVRFLESQAIFRFLWRPVESWELCDGEGRTVRSWEKQQEGLTWVDVDHRGRLLIGDRGTLMAWEGFPSGEPRVVADLNDNVFENVPPPDWATEW